MNLFLQNLTAKAFESLSLDPHFAQIKTSDRPDLSHYQCNGLLAIGRKEKKNPFLLAQQLVDILSSLSQDVLFSATIPGFINYTIKPSYLEKSIESFMIPDQLTPCHKMHVIIDYGGPNVAKPMHIGHLRSSIIGESLKRLFRFMGHHVTADIHMGDWGTQMGMLIVALQEKNPSAPYFDDEFEGPYPTSQISLEDLQEIYPQISERCKEDEILAEKARQATFELQQGHLGYRALWQHFVDISVTDMKNQFSRLGVFFDQWFGESRYQDQIHPLLEELKKKNLLQKSNGALVMNVSEASDKAEIPPLLLEKSAGGFLYATTDLATLRERVNVFKADLILYVVDGRQSLHFEQIFRAAEKAGYKAAYEFLGFGTINGSDNKPFKTRSGGAMRLSDVIGMLIDAAKKKTRETKLLENPSSETPASENIEYIAEKIGIAALKFGDLQHNTNQNYQFDIEKFTSFEGKTGPYLLYAIVRINALLKKSGFTSMSPRPVNLQNKEVLPQEITLMLWILRFWENMEKAFEKRAPHLLCDYAFELAQSFSQFYQACPILTNSVDPKTRNYRLFLAYQTKKTLEKILDILGIDCPPQM